MKIKELPIVLTCSLQYWRTGEWSAMLPFYSLDQLKGSEVNDTQCEIINTGSDEPSVLSSANAGAAVAKGFELRRMPQATWMQAASQSNSWRG
jgi:hypothetical protein